MNRIIYAVAIAMVATGLATGQTIDGPTTVKVGQAAWYSIKDLPPNAAFSWSPQLELQAGPPHIRDGHALFIPTSAGQRMLVGQMVTVDWAARNFSVVPLSIVVTVEGDSPNPPPPPGPRPANPFPAPDLKWRQSLAPLISAITDSKLPFLKAKSSAEKLGSLSSQLAAGALADSAQLFQAIGQAGKGADLGDAVAQALGAMMEKHNPHEKPLNADYAGWTLKHMAWALWEHSTLEAAR